MCASLPKPWSRSSGTPSSLQERRCSERSCAPRTRRDVGCMGADLSPSGDGATVRRVGAPGPVIDALERRFDETVGELVSLARIPGVSAPGFAAVELERSADAVAALL